MKGVYTSLKVCCFMLAIALSSQAFGQIDSVIVEKYYVSDANDATDADGGTLPVGSTTYRVYLDMAAGWELQSVFGNSDHDFVLSTSTYFWNNEDRGDATGHGIQDNRLDENTVALDSWISFGGASESHIGVQKSADGDGSIVGGANNDGGSAGIAGGLIVNNDPAICGIPVTTSDGLIPGVPVAITLVGDMADPLVGFGSWLADSFNSGATGETFTYSNGSYATLGGALGYTADNVILLGQFTTNGDFSFEMNVRLGNTVSGGFEQFVASNPVPLAGAISGTEIVENGLTFSSAGYNACAVPGCDDITACNYDSAATTDDGTCIYATGCDTCSGETDGTGTIVDNPEVGDSCDDMDATTVNDVIQADCSCAGTTVPGCMDANSCNYDAAATVDDGTCDGGATGCDTCSGETDGTGTIVDNPEVGDSCDDMDATTVNDVIQADCMTCAGTTVPGCMDANSCNYDAAATVDDGTCDGGPTGCDACSGATDGTGTIIDNPEVGDTCDDGDANTINDVIQANCACAGTGAILGCMDANSCNYNANANVDDGNCDGGATGCDTCSGETDGTGTIIDNPEVGDACDDGDATTTNDVIQADCVTCAGTTVPGCTDANASNYNMAATVDDGSCLYTVTFNVDMNCYSDDPNTEATGSQATFTTVGVTGPLFGWCANCASMTDMDGDGIYTIDLQLPLGTFEYKYEVNSFLGQEQLVDDMVAGATCAPVTDLSGFANRTFEVTTAGGTVDNTFGSCSDCVPGCTDANSCNYNAAATFDDGSCDGGPTAGTCDSCSGETDGTGTIVDNPEVGEMCDDGDPNTTNDMIQANCACVGDGVVSGCMDVNACNYNVNANTDDMSCVYATGCDTCSGETDGTGTVVDNPEVGDSCDDGDATTGSDVIIADCSCAGTPLVFGCTDANASNYNMAADTDDGSCLYSVTFSVDMNCYDPNNSDIETAAPYTGAAAPGVSGNFCGWCGDIFMTDADMDGIWDITIDLPLGAYEYKYWVDGFAGQEQLLDNDGESCVGVVAPPFANRTITVASTAGGQSVSGVYGDCAACDPNDPSGCTDANANNYDMNATVDDGSCTYDVTLNVDMNCFDGADPDIQGGAAAASFTTPAVESGTFGWCGSCVPMSDPDGDGVWTVTVSLGAGAFEYKYAHDVWAGEEQLIDNAGESCVGNTDGSTFANRVIMVPMTTMTNDVYGTCSPCNPPNPGCTDPDADNYDMTADTDDGSCTYSCASCVDACDEATELPFSGDFNFDGGNAFDDGTQMQINAGVDGTFAGHGFIIDPASITVTNTNLYCMFGDFTITADPSDYPLTIEFRAINDDGSGNLTQFNQVVTGDGTYTLGGNMATGIPGGTGFDINGGTPTLIVAIAHFEGTNTAAAINVQYSDIRITDGTCTPIPGCGSPCDNATPVALTEFGGTVGYIQDDLASGSMEMTCGGMNLTRWFSFVAQSPNDVIQAGTHPNLPANDSSLDVAIEVFDACDGMSLGCFDNYGAGALERVVTGTLIPGNTYYYAVSGATGTMFNTTVKTFADHMLRAQYCGVSDYMISDVIQAERDDLGEIYVHGPITVDGYAFQFSQGGNVIATIYQPGVANFQIQLNQVPGLMPGQVYDVATAHRVPYPQNGVVMSRWGSFGMTCTIGLDADIPNVEVVGTDCGESFTYGASNFISSTIAPGATAYQFRFTDTGSGAIFEFVHNNYGFLIHPTDAPGLPAGSYNVGVRARVGGVWGDYSNECIIHVDPAPVARPLDENSIVWDLAKDLDVLPGVSIYPNPNFGDVFRVSVDDLSDEMQKVTLTVMDMSGKTVYNEQFSNEGSYFNRVITLDSKLTSGIYMVNILANDVLITEKLVVE